ncbi:DUF4153 domain-containing protein [Massilia sp. P8910]|uniref:DUF4153 domain-containing protein n=1 Tax=Massilia antarctica TaxID=2765360 RepID=UPI001E3FE0C1|nr:DUF4153 domain-containing protein [Massilia antarctica]MCE3602299.1 DUF4153 domain-containing protein [Massilia antarctica]
MPTTPAVAVPHTPKHIGLARAAIGLVQGLLLYLLFADKAFTDPLIHTAALLACALAPFVAISGLGNLRPAMLALWSGVVASALTMIGMHAAWRETLLLEVPAIIPKWPSMLVLICFFSLIILFIGHSLVLAAAQDRRRLASYATHFDIAWKLFIQLAFSVFFTGALYLAMWLEASLFNLVKIGVLTELMKSSAFLSPMLACAFACALHLTDVRPAIVHGIRGLLLVLMSWLLPVATLLIGGFLLCLPFTGLDALWATRHATVALLAAVALLVVLINAAWQNGDMGDSVARVVRLCARIACVLPLPLTAIAAYALGLRVADHGWTSDRIFAAAALLVASFYAFGYVLAAVDRGGWLRRVAPVNLAAAYAVIAVLLALLSPLADPDRIAVNSQIARLERGAVSADAFDYRFLKTQSKRYGAAALLKLKEGKTGPQASAAAGHATRVLAEPAYRPGVEGYTVKPGQLAMWPASARLPASFPLSGWRRDSGVPPCLTDAQGRCDVFLIDFDADGKDEILMTAIDAYSAPVVLTEAPSGKWTLSARSYAMLRCPLFVEILKRGDYKLAAPRTRQIEIAGMPVRMETVSTPALGSCDELNNAVNAAKAARKD